MKVPYLCVTLAIALAGVVLAVPTAAVAAAPGNLPTISGGQIHRADPSWAVRLFIEGNKVCSGSLIAPRWVLTAATVSAGSSSPA